MAALTLKGGLFELGMLATGCINTILIKAADNTYARGWGGDEHLFAHPWTQSLFMFWAESVCMAAFLVVTYGPGSKGRGAKRPAGLLELFPPLLGIPACLDLLSTSIASIGLLYTSASVWQMLRGSVIVFSCIAWSVMLKKRTPGYRWVAVVVSILGLVLVGLSSVLTTASTSSSPADSASGSSSGSNSGGASSSAQTGWKTVVGIVLVLVAMVIQAVGMVIEEVLLRKKSYPPLQLVGMEGLIGTLLMMFVVLPVVYFIPGSNPSSMAHGSYDNAIDAFIMMGHSGPLLAFILVYMFSDIFYNVFGINVTKHLSAVHRTIIDACRSIFVWAWQLMTFYCISERYGERWTRYSGLQVAGFVLLSVGTVIYNGIVRLPYFSYESLGQDEKANETPETDTEQMANAETGEDGKDGKSGQGASPAVQLDSLVRASIV
eukprot:m51a1_g8459 hypothetical protein (434) ;mRNA; r:423906-425546